MVLGAALAWVEGILRPGGAATAVDGWVGVEGWDGWLLVLVLVLVLMLVLVLVLVLVCWCWSDGLLVMLVAAAAATAACCCWRCHCARRPRVE